MRAGKLDRRIALQRYSTTKNEFNEDVPAWSTFATVWAGKSYRRANETTTADEIAAIRVLRFEIRWSSPLEDLNPKDRIEYPIGSGTLFDITEVNEIGRREGLEIFATARADGEPN